MSEETEPLRKEILCEEFATIRLKKLKQQRRLLEEKQRRKRQEPQMVQANPDAFLLPQGYGWRKERLVGDTGLANPFLQEHKPQTSVCSRALSSTTTVSCGGDGSGKLATLLSPTEDCSDSDVEEVFVEDIPASPRLQRTRRWGWTTCQRPGPSRQDKSDPRYVRGEFRLPVPGLKPNVADQDRGDSASKKGENQDEKSKEELEFSASDFPGPLDCPGPSYFPGPSDSPGPSYFPGPSDSPGPSYFPGPSDSPGPSYFPGPSDSPGALVQVLSQAPEEEGDLGSNDVVSICLLPPAPYRLLSNDFEAYVLRPAMKEQIVQCRICRDRRGIDKGIFPFYYLYLEDANGGQQFLMAGRKRKGSKTSNYVISLDPMDMSRYGSKVVGKVRSNVLGTKFTIFDNGVNPERNFHSESARIREELGAVCYETNVLGIKGPRKMTVIIPAIDAENQRVSIQSQNGSLLDHLQMGVYQKLVLMHNKAPFWSKESGAYMLNFHGRVTRASVKNFQIVHPDNPNRVVLQFGRVAPDTFTMDFAFPLCPVQAFAICLSSFDRKLACE